MCLTVLDNRRLPGKPRKIESGRWRLAVEVSGWKMGPSRVAAFERVRGSNEGSLLPSVVGGSQRFAEHHCALSLSRTHSQKDAAMLR